MSTVRKTHVRILELVDEGYFNALSMLENCLAYMSVDDIKGMLEANDIELPGEEDDDDTEDGEDSTDAELADSMGTTIRNAWGEEDIDD